ncbi:MAG: helix-turn-helix domain-containing protein [Candidatus Gastranaerophilaceae bacterium]
MIENRFAILLAERKLDKTDIVRITGLDNHTINKIYKNQTNRITFNTLNKLCFALECTPNDIFKYIPD